MDSDRSLHMPATPIQRRDALRLAATAGLTVSISAVSPAWALASSAPSFTNEISELIDGIAWRLLETDPAQATSLGLDNGTHADLRWRLNDRSAASVARIADLLNDDLAKVEALDSAKALTEIDTVTRTSIAVVKTAYRVALDGFALPYGDVAVGGWRNTPYVVIQNVGAYLDTPRFLDAVHPINTAADAEAYLARLSAMAAQLNGELERMKMAGAIGLIPPDFLIDRTLAQLRQIMASIGSVDDGSDLVGSLVRRTASIPGEWERFASQIVNEGVRPALEAQLAELTAQRAVATSDAGMRARPHGEAWYAWALHASTTTRHTPEEIHALGWAELAALHARMDPILKSLGFTAGSVEARMAALGMDRRYRFRNDATGRAEIIALMRSKLDFIQTRLPLAFRRLERGNLEILRLPQVEEAGAPNAYGSSGSIDGSRPGKIWINLSDTGRHTRYSVPTLGFHEGIPGHVWQSEYSSHLPMIRSLLAFNAYSEGWALYSEQLADEMGAYDGDKIGQLGYLQSLASRACRMIVDTGLHAAGWTRDQAIDWFARANATRNIDVINEIDRYCSWPGQACGYKLGHSEIVRQREVAKSALGARYDLRDFNQVVVDGGNVPLDELEKSVRRYVENVGSKS